MLLGPGTYVARAGGRARRGLTMPTGAEPTPAPCIRATGHVLYEYFWGLRLGCDLLHSMPTFARGTHDRKGLREGPYDSGHVKRLGVDRGEKKNGRCER